MPFAVNADRVSAHSRSSAVPAGAEKHHERARLNARLEDSLAGTLKRANPDYAAAVFRKWQLFRDPSEMGFDAHDGITQNADGESDDPRDPTCGCGTTPCTMACKRCRI